MLTLKEELVKFKKLLIEIRALQVYEHELLKNYKFNKTILDSVAELIEEKQYKKEKYIKKSQADSRAFSVSYCLSEEVTLQ